MMQTLGLFAVDATKISINLSKKNVLVLNSYHDGYKWTDDVDKGIDEVLSKSSIPMNIIIEYMDSKRIYDVQYVQQLVDMYKHKYHKTKFDVIISSDDNAFDFLVKFREQLFEGAPVVYCGTNDITSERASELNNSTGINDALSIKENIQLIQNLHPEVNEIAIIVDSTTTGKRIRGKIESILPYYQEKITINIMQNFSINELMDNLQKLPKTTAVLYTVFLKDKDGVFIEYDDSINLVTKASSSPVYISWDFSMGSGAVGGLLTSGKAQGEAAANLALRILNGTKADSLPYLKDSPNHFIFDYNVLKHFNISRDLLPTNSTIINLPEEYSKKYRELIWKSIVIGTVLTIIILLLIVNILRRRRAEIMLSDANEKLENRVKLRTKELEQTNSKLNEKIEEKIVAEQALHKSERLLKTTSNIAKVGGWELEAANRKLTWTEEIYRISEIDLSYEPELEEALNYYHPDSRPAIREAVLKAIELGEPFDLELKLITAKGNHKWCRAKGEAVKVDGKVVTVFGTFQDITQRKEYDDLLAEQRKRLRVLNSIIRHDISNDLAVIKSAVKIFKKNPSDNMLDEIVSRVNKSTKIISEFKSHKEFIDSNIGLIEINLSKMFSKLSIEYPMVRMNINKKCSVYADEALHYVFTNLVSNSLKHGKATEIDIEVRKDRNYCIIKICDNGKGIADSIKPRIFDEGFYSGATGHTGMGLYLAKQTIEQYGGIISVEDNQPQGTVFSICLRKALLR